jgi:hypothetical protein
VEFFFKGLEHMSKKLERSTSKIIDFDRYKTAKELQGLHAVMNPNCPRSTSDIYAGLVKADEKQLNGGPTLLHKETQ